MMHMVNQFQIQQWKKALSVDAVIFGAVGGPKVE